MIFKPHADCSRLIDDVARKEAAGISHFSMNDNREKPFGGKRK